MTYSLQETVRIKTGSYKGWTGKVHSMYKMDGTMVYSVIPFGTSVTVPLEYRDLVKLDVRE